MQDFSVGLPASLWHRLLKYPLLQSSHGLQFEFYLCFGNLWFVNKTSWLYLCFSSCTYDTRFICSNFSRRRESSQTVKVALWITSIFKELLWKSQGKPVKNGIHPIIWISLSLYFWQSKMSSLCGCHFVLQQKLTILWLDWENWKWILL